jgi:maltose alpha-D-glucosyltransferase/alpha-amylase
MNRYLTAQGFIHAPSLVGDVVRVAPDGTPSTLAIALEFVRNEGDAWAWMLDHLNRALDAHSPAAAAENSGADLFADCDAVIAAIGRRLGEMQACDIGAKHPRPFCTWLPTPATRPIGRRIPKTGFKKLLGLSLNCRRGSATRTGNAHRSF